MEFLLNYKLFYASSFVVCNLKCKWPGQR